MTWQEFILRVLDSDAAGMILLAAIGAAGTWIIRRLKLSEQQRQQAMDALRGGVEWVWEQRARKAKAAGVKLSPEQREEFRRQATGYARELAKDKGIDLDKVLMSEEVINGIIHEIISARRQGETAKPNASEVARAKLGMLGYGPDRAVEGWPEFPEARITYTDSEGGSNEIKFGQDDDPPLSPAEA